MQKTPIQENNYTNEIIKIARMSVKPIKKDAQHVQKDVQHVLRGNPIQVW